MNDLDVSNFLPILSIGLWVGVFMVFVAKMFSFVLTTIINWFKRI